MHIQVRASAYLSNQRPQSTTVGSFLSNRSRSFDRRFIVRSSA